MTPLQWSQYCFLFCGVICCLKWWPLIETPSLGWLSDSFKSSKRNLSSTKYLTNHLRSSEHCWLLSMSSRHCFTALSTSSRVAVLWIFNFFDAIVFGIWFSDSKLSSAETHPEVEDDDLEYASAVRGLQHIKLFWYFGESKAAAILDDHNATLAQFRTGSELLRTVTPFMRRS